MGRWFFKTQEQKRIEAERREAKQLNRKLKREAAYYAKLIPQVLANMGIDHWLPMAQRPTIIEEKLVGIKGRQRVEILEVQYDENVIDLLVDTRVLPYHSDVSRLHTEEVLETLTDACRRKVVWINEIGCGAWFQIWRNGAVNAIPKLIPFSRILPEIPENAPPLFFIAGLTVNNRLMKVNLAVMPHYLVAGSTFTGKSVHLNAILCQLISRNTPATLQLLMIDLKRGAEFAPYKTLPHLWRPTVIEMEDVPDRLREFREEMDRRMDLITRRGLATMEEFNAMYPNEAMPYLVLVFDELAMIMTHDDRKLVKLATAQLNAIMAASRSSGGHAILCTQRPASDVISSNIKVNAAGRICFAVPGNQDSIVVIDSGMASKIDREIPGRAILSVGPSLTEVQTPNITRDQRDKIIKAALGLPAEKERATGVTIEEVLTLAIDNHNGSLSIHPLFNDLRNRIPRSELQRMLSTLNGDAFNIRGIDYKIEHKAQGKHGGTRIVRVGTRIGLRHTTEFLKGRQQAAASQSR